MLYGNNEQNGIMQACGAASKGPSKSKKHQSKQRLIALLAELIGIVSDSPTHPDCQHGRSSAQCGSNLTQVCVNADIDILNSMRLHDMLQHNVHYQTCQYQTCQLIHTIVNPSSVFILGMFSAQCMTKKGSDILLRAGKFNQI